jgi:hypothetical protein
MNWMELLYDVCEVLVFPLLGILTAYIIKLINSKIDQIKQRTDSALVDKYLDILNDTISECVTSTTQTYVASLKDSGEFTAEAHKKAFDMTFNNVLGILSEDAKNVLGQAVGDLDTYITSKIEAQVNYQK